MKHDFEIPEQLQHLKLDERGYPIPYFVPIIDGIPNFRFAHFPKIKDCIEHNRCGICGLKLYSDYSYIITGPIGMTNQVSTDAPMHRVCAEFSLMACPHLFYKKAERKETNPGVQQHVLLTKPKEMMLVKAKTKFKWVKYDEGIFKYWYVSHEVYGYINNQLQKK